MGRDDPKPRRLLRISVKQFGEAIEGAGMLFGRYIRPSERVFSGFGNRTVRVRFFDTRRNFFLIFL